MGGTCRWVVGTVLHVALLLSAVVSAAAAGARGTGVKSGSTKAKPNFVYDLRPTAHSQSDFVVACDHVVMGAVVWSILLSNTRFLLG